MFTELFYKSLEAGMVKGAAAGKAARGMVDDAIAAFRGAIDDLPLHQRATSAPGTQGLDDVVRASQETRIHQQLKNVKAQEAAQAQAAQNARHQAEMNLPSVMVDPSLQRAAQPKAAPKPIAQPAAQQQGSRYVEPMSTRNSVTSREAAQQRMNNANANLKPGEQASFGFGPPAQPRTQPRAQGQQQAPRQQAPQQPATGTPPPPQQPAQQQGAGWAAYTTGLAAVGVPAVGYGAFGGSQPSYGYGYY